MKTTFSFLLAFLSLTSCQVESEKSYRNWHKNPIRFITENPNSQEFEQALKRYFEIEDSIFKTEDYPLWHCRGNCFHILSISNTRRCIAEDKVINLDSLQYSGYEFLTNFSNSENLSESIILGDGFGNNISISKGIFYIQLDSVLDANSKFTIQQVCASIALYKEFLAQTYYKKTYNNLAVAPKAFLDSALGKRMFIDPGYFSPPPPSPPDSIVWQIETDTILEVFFEEEN